MTTGRTRSFVRALLLAFVLSLTMIAPAFAQEEAPISEMPAPEKGICAPWHKCMAYGGLAISVIVLGALGVGYLVQNKGFDTVEHKMGQPHGTPVKKE